MNKPLKVGRTYSRNELFQHLGISPIPNGGDWFTGYTRHDDEWFIFANVGIAGRTGHDHVNQWIGIDLQWNAKPNTRIGQPSITAMTANSAIVHIFTREDDRDPFVYEGLAVPRGIEDRKPVRVLWAFPHRGTRPVESPPEEVLLPESYVEGATRRIFVNTYERNPAARKACIAFHGARCSACTVDLEEIYGELARGFIHVHHLKELSSVGEAYEVNPLYDLRPVCPNCHAIIHRSIPALSIEQLKKLISAGRDRA
jgi:5-methylcytosine-specific restriction protein A